ncbi:60S ribosomal protein L21A [Cystobasidiomycetes sp. EMM_F5]
MFKRGFKKGGQINTSTYLRVFKIGDIVDIVPNAAQHKSLPHKYYVGRTGVIYNISPRAVGVIIYKPVGNRYLEKRVNLRVEHVRISKCRTDFLRRVKENAQKKREAKDKGEKVRE